MKKNPVVYTHTQALVKAQAYCAAQERCQQEVRQKLYDWGMFGDDAELVIADLIGGGFLNEERFAESFCRGKFRIKHWGKQKITYELKQRKISSICIKKGLLEIDGDEYIAVLRELIHKKTGSKKLSLTEKQKTAAYLISKGFESDLVFKELKDFNTDTAF